MFFVAFFICVIIPGFLTEAPTSGLQDAILPSRLCAERCKTSPCSCNYVTTEECPECVQLAVPEETEVVSTCCTHGGACTPAVRLLATPGSITVQLSTNHSLIDELGFPIQHRIYFGQRGSPLEFKGSYPASKVMPRLEEGRSYCASVQFTCYDQPVGLPSCAVCERVPESRGNTAVIASVVMVVFFFLSLPVFFVVFQPKRVKQLLRLPYHIPAGMLEPIPVSVNPNKSVEECYDKISQIDAI